MLPSLSREQVSVSWQGTDSDRDLGTRTRRNCRKESSNVEGQRHFENRSPPEWDAIQTHFRCHCSSLQQLIPWITQLRSAARLISCWVINLFPSILDYYLDSTRWVYWWPFCFLILSERISVQYHRKKNDTTVESSSTQRYLVPSCHIFHKYTPTNLLHDPFMDQSPPPLKLSPQKITIAQRDTYFHREAPS